MSRTDKIRSLLKPALQVGVEIGPLDKPIVGRGEGSIYYVDHASTEDLLIKYSDDPAVDNDRIEEVDFVWGEQGIADLLGDLAPVDYVVASHVIEHVPDVVGWLREIAEALETGGILALAIPDRRFTFDFARPCSTWAEVIGAHLERSRRPSPRQVFEYFTQVVVLDAYTAWALPVKPNELRRHHAIDEALANARASAEGRYVDVHCWVFTPESFVTLMGELVEIGLLDFAIAEFIPTAKNELEFFVSFTKLDPDALDKRQVQRDSLRAAQKRIAESESPVFQDGTVHQTLVERNDDPTEREQLLHHALADRDRRLELISCSTSWRVTAPLRFVGQMLERRKPRT